MAILEFVSHLLILLGAAYKIVDWVKKRNKQRETRNFARQLFQEYRNRLQEIAVAQQTTDRPVAYKTKYGTSMGGSSHSDGNQCVYKNAQSAVFETTKEFMNDLDFTEREHIVYLSENDRSKFKQALYDMKQSHGALLKGNVLNDVSQDIAKEILESFESRLPWLQDV